MAEIIAAIDEGAANTFLGTAIGALPPLSDSGSGNLGPFLASYSVSATVSAGTVDLIVPDIIRINNIRLNFSLNLSIGIDLSTILPDFCLPQVCVNIPCVGRVCTPRICIDRPTISVSLPFSDFIEADADFRLQFGISSGNWNVEAVVVGLPTLRFGLATGALLAAIGVALTPVLLAVPFIGPFLAIAANAILLAIGIAGVTGLLGPILTPFISGIVIPIHRVPQLFQMLPAEGPFDPPVNFTIDLIEAKIINDGEDELVLSADISP